MPFCLFHDSEWADIWTEALSSCRYHLPARAWSATNGRKCSSSVSVYFTLFVDSSTNARGLTPSNVMQPQTINLSVVVWPRWRFCSESTDHFSSVFLHNLRRPFGLRFIISSSLKITLFKWLLTVQCSLPLQYWSLFFCSHHELPASSLECIYWSLIRAVSSWLFFTHSGVGWCLKFCRYLRNCCSFLPFYNPRKCWSTSCWEHFGPTTSWFIFHCFVFTRVFRPIDFYRRRTI